MSFICCNNLVKPINVLRHGKATALKISIIGALADVWVLAFFYSIVNETEDVPNITSATVPVEASSGWLLNSSLCPGG